MEVVECSQGAGKLLSSRSFQLREEGLPGPVLLLVQLKIWRGESAHKTTKGMPLLTSAPWKTPTLWTSHDEGEAGSTEGSQWVENQRNLGEGSSIISSFNPDIFEEMGAVWVGDNCTSAKYFCIFPP